MKLSAKLAKEKYDYNKDSETHLLIKLEAPKMDWQKSRAPICIVPVIDVSGSMAGEKIDYVKKSCRKLIDHLSIGDFIGMVTFDSHVYQISKITEITQYNKDELKKKVSEFVAGTCTNMSGGLEQGLRWLNESGLPDNVILRAILFTDGHANVGISGKNLIDFVKKHIGKASLSAFGFGTDCDQELLADLANSHGGSYAFIDSQESALTAFARELGGLMSTYGQDIKINISTTDNEVLEILNDETVTVENNETIVHLRDILSEEQKFIVARVKLSGVEKVLPRKVSAFKISCSYKDKDNNKQKTDVFSVKIKFCKAGEEPSLEDMEVVRHRDRLNLAKAQLLANRYVIMGDFVSARNAFYTFSNSAQTEDLKDLAQTLSLNYVSSQAYDSSIGQTMSYRCALNDKRCSSNIKLDGSVACSSNDAILQTCDSFTSDSFIASSTGAKSKIDEDW